MCPTANNTVAVNAVVETQVLVDLATLDLVLATLVMANPNLVLATLDLVLAIPNLVLAIQMVMVINGTETILEDLMVTQLAGQEILGAIQ